MMLERKVQRKEEKGFEECRENRRDPEILSRQIRRPHAFVIWMKRSHFLTAW